MQYLSRILISLPLCALPLLAAAPHASASGLRPSDAVRLLAQSRTADERCQYLNAADHQQLADYVARAEVAAARIDGVATTKAARVRGDAGGRAMPCNASSRIVVTATLAAARRAEKQLGPKIAEMEKQAKKDKARQRQAASNPVQPRKNARVAALQAPRPVPADKPNRLFSLSGSGSGLALYTRQAAAYYIERRCQFLSSGETMAFWKAIVARHNAMIARYGGAAVRRAKGRAEQAGAAACGGDAAVFVRAAWQDMQR